MIVWWCGASIRRNMPLMMTGKGSVKGKVALITGATSGIGRAMALAFAEAGASVVVGDVREQPISGERPTADIIRGSGGRALFVLSDVADKSQVEALVREALREFGRIDILVNNAGIGHVSAVEHTPDKVLRRLVEINFYGAVYGVQAVLPAMRAQGAGHIINISSGAAVLGLPYAAIYAATKAAIVRFSEALRCELENSNIHVSTIYPDFTATDLALEVTTGAGTATRTVRSLNRQGIEKYGIPTAGLQTPEEVARVVLACALRPRGEIYLSSRIRFSELARYLFPSALEREARLIRRSVQQFLEKVSKDGSGTAECRKMRD